MGTSMLAGLAGSFHFLVAGKKQIHYISNDLRQADSQCKGCYKAGSCEMQLADDADMLLIGSDMADTVSGYMIDLKWPYWFH